MSYEAIIAEVKSSFNVSVECTKKNLIVIIVAMHKKVSFTIFNGFRFQFPFYIEAEQQLLKNTIETLLNFTLKHLFYCFHNMYTNRLTLLQTVLQFSSYILEFDFHNFNY